MVRKMRKATILIGCFVCLMLCLGAYPSMMAEEKGVNVKECGEITLEFMFEKPSAMERGDYYEIVMPGLKNYGEPGAPVLPFRTVKVLIPQGRDVDDINVVTGCENVLDGGFRVECGQRPAPLSSGIVPETLPDPKIYNSMSAYPDSVYTYVSVQEFRGYRILILNLHPVKYIPKTGTISYFKNITVAVTTHSTKEYVSNPTFRGLSKDEERVKKMVDNPWIANTYTALSAPTIHSRSVNPSESYDYVIITNQNLNASFQPLIDSKIEKGLTATTVTVEDIVADPAYWVNGTWGDNNSTNPFYKNAITNYAMFNDTQAKIRNFIRDAFCNWETEYVLLGGDADAGGPGLGGDNDPAPIIPHRGFYGVVNNDDPGSDPDFDIPSDLYYAALNGTWNDDEDNRWGEDGEADLLAEVYVGRAPADSKGEVNNFVDKTLAYEHTVDDYLKEVLLVGEYLWADGWGGESMNEVANNIPSSYTVSKLYDSDWKMVEKEIDISEYTGNKSVRVRFRVESNASEVYPGWYIDNVEVTDGGGNIIFFDDMEKGENGWTHGGAEDEWELGSPQLQNLIPSCANLDNLVPYSGNNCWGTDLDDTYNKNCNQSLVSPVIDLTGVNNAWLKFYHWHYFEKDKPHVAFGHLEISTDDGNTWEYLENYTKAQGWARDALTDILNSNVHIVSHFGHSNVPMNMKLNSNNVDALTNDHYFLVYSQGCYAGAFDNRWSNGVYGNLGWGDCIGEHFVCQDVGAFAYIGNSRYGWGGSSGYFNTEFFDAVYNEGKRNIGIANQDSKEDNVGLIGTNSVRWCYYELNLLGDPEVSIKDPVPKDDWVVTREDERNGPENIILNGNIIVKDGGKLTLTDGIILQLNCSYDGEYRIEVQNGGALQIDYSILMPAPYTHGFEIYIKPGGSFNTKGTSIINCGYSHCPALTIEGKAVVEDSDVLSSDGWGIYIYNSSNNIINNTNLWNNYGGIYVSYSDKNNIINNDIWNNTYYGVYLEHSNNNIIDNNVIRENNDTGLRLYYSQGNTVSNCSIHDSDYGFLIESSSNNKLTNNVLENNNYNFGVNGLEEEDFYQDIDTSNTINGKPIYYFVNQTNPVFDAENAGYTGLVNVTNAKIENADIRYNLQGILAAYSSDVEITDSTFTNNTCSIYIYQSVNITADYCVASGSIIGIGVYSGGMNTLSNNTVSGNEYGIVIGVSDSNRIVENHFSFNNRTGIYLYMASYNIVGYNVFERLGGSIQGWDAHRNIIDSNDLSAGGYIEMEYCSNETIANNTISKSDVDAIYFDNTHNCTITNNTISETTGNVCGIKLYESNGNIIKDDNKIYLNYYGIYLDASKENEIYGNDIYSNEFGVWVAEMSAGNHINWNKIQGNNQYGIYTERYLTETVDAEWNWWGNYTGPYDNSNDTIDGGDYNPYGTGDKVTDYVGYRPWLYASPETVYIITKMYASGESLLINVGKVILLINTSGENKSAEKLAAEQYLRIVIVEYEANPSRDESIPEGTLPLGSYFEIYVEPRNPSCSIYVEIYYTQDELDMAGVDENSITGIYFLDEVTGKWQSYSDTGVDTTDTMEYAGYAWAYMDKLGSIGIFASMDTSPPTITHAPVISWRNNTEIVIDATITDNVGVESAVLFYRKATERSYSQVQMDNTGENVWAGTIPASAVTSAGLEYYIWATDGKNNATTLAYTVTVPTTTATIIEGREVRVYYNGTRNLTVRNVASGEREILGESVPVGRGDIGLFVDVNITGVFRNAFITMRYNDSDVVEVDETTLKMYYWNETTNEWIIIEDSGVWANNNTVWANVTHLTIFAPMAEKVVNTPPTSVTLNTPTGATKSSLTLTWSKNADLDFARYGIYKSTSSGTLGTLVATINTNTTNTYTVTGLTAGTTYYFTVRVVDTGELYSDSNQVGGTTSSAPKKEKGFIPGFEATVLLAAIAVCIILLRRKGQL